MKRSLLVIWMLGTVLAIGRLLALAGEAQHSAGFWQFTAGLLFCYSLPFFILLWIGIPDRRSPEQYITLTLFVLICAISLFIPTRRFMPGYHPAALEGLAYVFIPAFEGGLIALFLLVRSLCARLFRKG
ncbi:MAG: hypothetical protein ACR2IV_05645 [Bryobacteraceae bacterium]